MQVWLFAAKRSQLPQLKCSLWQPQGRAGTKWTFPSQKKEQKRWKPQLETQWTFQLQKPGMAPEVASCFSQKRKWIRVWDELNWMESGGTTAANVFLPVCKHAVSKSRPSSGIITAQHHMTSKRPAPNITTQDWHGFIFIYYCLFKCLMSPFPFPLDKG